MTSIRRNGLLIMLSSPSGAGKSTLSQRVLASDPAVSFSISATTRPARPGEVDGQHYYFRTEEQFRAMIADGQMLEHAEVFGNLYGTPRGPVEAAVKEGRDIVFDVDWQGGQQIRNSDLRDAVVSIFILPPSIEALADRLRTRAQDSDEVIAGRMRKSRDEISHWAEYDYVLVNDDIDACEAELRAIITAERLKRDRRPGLLGHVQALNDEFTKVIG